ncbi:MAG: TlpA family protein disulfide reductase [Thermoplasmata archaeon]|nr:MAG: TlpA family protein disulfide reductase [Thermoplasmata archaeon]
MRKGARTARLVAVTLVALTMTVSMCIGGGLGKGDPAPDFDVTDVDGIAHQLEDFEGRVLVVDFFTTWCVYCTDQIVAMEEVRDTYSEDQVAILWVDPDDRESKDKVAEYRVKYDITWPMTYKSSDMGTDYMVDAYPTTVVIDGDGVIQYYHTGTVTTAKLMEVIDDLV